MARRKKLSRREIALMAQAEARGSADTYHFWRDHLGADLANQLLSREFVDPVEGVDYPELPAAEAQATGRPEPLMVRKVRALFAQRDAQRKRAEEAERQATISADIMARVNAIFNWDATVPQGTLPERAERVMNEKVGFEGCARSWEDHSKKLDSEIAALHLEVGMLRDALSNEHDLANQAGLAFNTSTVILNTLYAIVEASGRKLISVAELPIAILPAFPLKPKPKGA